MKVLFEGIYSKYNGSSALKAKINGMYPTEAPQGATYPYAVYHKITGVPDWTFDADMENCVIQFNIYDNSNSSTNVNSAYDALTTLYDWCDLSVTGYSHIYMKRLLDRLERVDEKWLYVCQYRLEIQKN